MKIRSLSLENFRSYPKLDIEFGSSPITILLGPNATGKTNLLEAIAVLASSHSPLGVEDADLLTWGSHHYRIHANTERDGGEEITLEVASQLSPRKARITRRNGVKTALTHYLGTLPIVLFHPSHLDLFTGSPEGRRAFLDHLLCQVSLEYRLALEEYRRVLKQRNTLLKKFSSSERSTWNEQRATCERQLAPWDEKVADLGSRIILERSQLVSTLNVSLREELRTFGEHVGQASIHYRHHGESPDPERLQRELLDALKHVHERDVLLQATSIGPHRDDWFLDLDGHDAAVAASRGQQRAAVLALLLLSATYLELTIGEKPVLLLDDIFSELDEAHEAAVLRACDRTQTLITATHLPGNLPSDLEVRRCPLGANVTVVNTKRQRTASRA